MTAHVVQSALLASHGIPHCFSTRVGGVSGGVFASLNLGNPSELERERRDPPANIRENFRRILDAMGCAGRAISEVHQVHAAAVAWASGPAASPATPDPRADAILTDDPSRVVVVRVADCAPVLLASADGTVVGAVHAGWRGVIAGVLPAAISAMRARGAGELLAAIGPCIGAEHFEVGPEVAAEFGRVFGRADGGSAIVRPGVGDRSLVDLKEALRRQLAASGVERWDISPHCTFRDVDWFYSHRRDRGVTGRTAALIGPRTR